MGVRTKSITHQSKKPEPRHSAAVEGASLDSVLLLPESGNELNESKQLTDVWESVGCDECHHWRKRYCLRNEEAQKLEGLLNLRDARITELEKDLAKANKQIHELRTKVFGRTSEQDPVHATANTPEPQQATENSAPSSSVPAAETAKNKRGKRKGAPGFGPQSHESLPIGDEIVYDLDESCCPECGDQFKEMCEEQSYEVEVEVRAYRRKHRRKKYGHFCKAKGRWVTKRAKGPRRLFPHSTYGISVWVFLLNGKFALLIPINRLCILLKQKGLRIPPGTVVAGFYRILLLIRPLIAEIKRYSREEKSHWHIDDAGWKTFVKIEGKDSFKWYLWVFRSNDVCLYIASPSRAREVPKSHLKDSCGVVSCDRLQSNRKLGDFLTYSFCWVHERRRFRQLFAAYPELQAECEEFLHLIENLFHFNKQRLLAENASIEEQKNESDLSDTLSSIRTRIDEHLGNAKLHEELKSALTGIRKDWDGLYAFFDLPAIPPHNNPAEQALRGPVVGRKNYYGSGSEESAELAAAMFTLNATLSLNNINLESFLTEYLQACADNGGNPPPNAASFLPWHRKPPPAD